MKFLFNNSTKTYINKNIIENIKRAIEQTLEYEKFTKNVEISFSIVTNKEIKKLNNKFRNINRETDVLSFPLIENFKTNFIEEIPIYLGDIIISIEMTKSQAIKYGHSFNREICFLTVHSMLHLLGYDHSTKEEEIKMFKKQEDILNILNIKR